MSGKRYSPTIRRRALEIHESMRGHVNGAEISRMLKSEGHGTVPGRTVNLWTARKSPLSALAESIEHQAVRVETRPEVQQLEATARSLAKLAEAMAARLRSQVPKLMIKSPEDAGRIADAMLTITRSSIEASRAVDSLRSPIISNFAETKPPIDRQAQSAEVNDFPFKDLAKSNFQ